jgi:hypothetical protein
MPYCFLNTLNLFEFDADKNRWIVQIDHGPPFNHFQALPTDFHWRSQNAKNISKNRHLHVHSWKLTATFWRGLALAGRFREGRSAAVGPPPVIRQYSTSSGAAIRCEPVTRTARSTFDADYRRSDRASRSR